MCVCVCALVVLRRFQVADRQRRGRMRRTSVKAEWTKDAKKGEEERNFFQENYFMEKKKEVLAAELKEVERARDEIEDRNPWLVFPQLVELH